MLSGTKAVFKQSDSLLTVMAQLHKAWGPITHRLRCCAIWKTFSTAIVCPVCALINQSILELEKWIQDQWSPAQILVYLLVISRPTEQHWEFHCGQWLSKKLFWSSLGQMIQNPFNAFQFLTSACPGKWRMLTAGNLELLVRRRGR